MPELVVSVVAGIEGKSEIALANVVGSNIFNVLFILGACACIAPLKVQQQLVTLEVPIMIGASATCWFMASDLTISVNEGLLLTSGIIFYTVWAIRKSRRESKAVHDEYAKEYGGTKGAQSGTDRLRSSVMLVAAGIGLLILGGNWLIDSAVLIARDLGVSDSVIGLTLIAAGTSLTEVATSITATLKGERDIAVGNVIGSNIYNILTIAGLSSLVTPGGLAVADSMLAFDIPVMFAVAVICLPLFFTGYSIERWEGVILFLGYVTYTAYLVLQASSHDALPLFTATMAWVVLPAIALGIVVTLLGALRKRTS
jgi:cation:H+ antiporter